MGTVPPIPYRLLPWPCATVRPPITTKESRAGATPAASPHGPSLLDPSGAPDRPGPAHRPPWIRSGAVRRRSALALPERVPTGPGHPADRRGRRLGSPIVRVAAVQVTRRG